MALVVFMFLDTVLEIALCLTEVKKKLDEEGQKEPIVLDRLSEHGLRDQHCHP